MRLALASRTHWGPIEIATARPIECGTGRPGCLELRVFAAARASAAASGVVAASGPVVAGGRVSVAGAVAAAGAVVAACVVAVTGIGAGNRAGAGAVAVNFIFLPPCLEERRQDSRAR